MHNIKCAPEVICCQETDVYHVEWVVYMQVLECMNATGKHTSDAAQKYIL